MPMMKKTFEDANVSYWETFGFFKIRIKKNRTTENSPNYKEKNFD
jgi:hypothetical protein